MKVARAGGMWGTVLAHPSEILSFTNLSSTGLSDVVPITGQARSVVMFEQLAGLGYVALFVSRLVGLTVAWQMIAASSNKRAGHP